jgi:hypothetical protein
MDLTNHLDYENIMDMIGLSKDMKRKKYISPREIKRYCPHVRLTPHFEPGMKTFEIMSESVPAFFRENRVVAIYMNKDHYRRMGPIQIELETTTIIKCLVDNSHKG